MESTRPLFVYNTMTGAKEKLVLRSPPKLGIYVCGPTVYSFVHIGNARTFTSFDVVVRYLRYRGYQVTYVRNYTDVDDKIINAARVVGQWSDGSHRLTVDAEGFADFDGSRHLWTTDGKTLTLLGKGDFSIDIAEAQLRSESLTLKRESAPANAVEHAARFVREFEADAAALHLLAPDVAPKVSETIPEIVALISQLVERGVAYVSKGDVYFSVNSYPQYARLSKRNVDDLKAGARVDPGDVKREPLDFALWKAAKPGEPAWESPWGKGRPGWHIECSAMSRKYLGETFDLHGGGLDLIFPHHENEIAQSEAASQTNMCNCWMHGGFLDLEGAKMSKSLGNVVRLRDALQKVDPEALRYFFLSTHYRAPLAFTDKSLSDADSRMEYFYETLQKVNARPDAAPTQSETDPWLSKIEAEMDDDFNFAGALGHLSGLFAEMNQRLIDKDKAKANAALSQLKASVKRISSVLGLFEDDPSEWLKRRRDRLVQQKNIDVAKIEALIVARNEARKAKDFKQADVLRDSAKALGVELLDGPSGTTWKVLSD